MYKEIIQQLANDYAIKDYRESFSNVIINIETSLLLAPNFESVKNFIDKISKRDSIRFKILDGEFVFAQYSNGSSIEKFVKEINEGINEECENLYKINIEIVKNVVNNELSIYDIKLFLEHLKEQSLRGLLYEFNTILKDNYIIFRLQKDNINFASNSIFFSMEGEEINYNTSERDNQLNRRIEVCNFLNSSEYKLLASDFEFCNYNNTNAEDYLKLESIMNKMKNVLAIIGICDISAIDEKNQIRVVLNGYKRIECLINYEDNFDAMVDQYYKIYQWLYDGGNLSDKVGIARNIISLQISNNNLLSIEKNTLDSIRSSYEIYLKESVNKYLELRANINKNILILLSSLGGLIDELISIILRFIVGGLSVVFTVIVMNSITSGNLVEVITGDLAIICIGAIIILNIILFGIIVPNIKDKFKRYENEFEDMKETYRYILNPEDLDKIFDKNKFINGKKEDFSKGLKKYMKLWTIIQIILVATILIA
ncbi:hypothetical protein CLHOM_24370 [Clostridium homopropionicum DSM 5847]|uniref:Uncharacterized protein n=1 Tax=Clostridium homopropionicum DSM 5847 TaxID=1121318 RepID=A0A0L6Z8N5_9CLOT|nr:hypothetical protein [Clostridium homopropionicum]KOA19331.1 hypothetical protein CLHOM_24370 [Clostridium homopropionicum DSM 5847]SFG21430.1 hypothetical protein SAMN04488501_106197 [Clostridium homopropionicum]